MKKIEFTPLKCFEDDRGAVLHFMKSNDTFFSSFGECYFSWINPGYIKGWYCHTRLTSCFTSPTMNLKVILFNKNAEITVIDIRKDHYGLIKIPEGVWYSFQSTDERPALIVNMLNGLYDPAECKRLPLDTPDIPYCWGQ
jgi:dTDP-4-dehydrorhamnose 3,5-epimerase